MTYDSARRQRDVYNRWWRWYDFSTKLAELTRGFSDIAERRKAVGRLDLKPGQRVLEVGVGTGENLPLLAESVGATGRPVGLDISTAMLRRCRQKLDRDGVRADLIEGEATNLPFADDEFDAVLNFGSFNGLDNRERALEEMMRVAKPGAKIVIADEGMAKERRNTFRGKLFLRFDPWLGLEPPLELLPPNVRDLHITWFRADYWYLVDFVNEQDLGDGMT
ncbi:MAG: hypothetical protein A2148_06775 [Chloroflexi bacterium RBG_16_68_14]|nr:MAG: hypothetical protein A2148_06775 [Chloroflexi bacterium RBG_16_68_14]